MTWWRVFALAGLVGGVVFLAARERSSEPGVASLPGATPFNRKTEEKIQNAMKNLPENYVPRAHHLNADKTPTYTNRLISEASPYLLQHAHNPVDWHAWGEEAFEKARRDGKPVLLSVGYSTCHWCHVMERESFEDLEIAQFMNENYVAIKVDREERPDVDAIYMAAVQMLTGSGGWPMTVWLTPDKRPFYGGTYFPARDGDRGPHAGFLTLLQRLVEVYRTQSDKVEEQGRMLAAEIASNQQLPGGSDVPGVDALHKGYQTFAEQYDDVHGGFGFAPKFPRPVVYSLLFHYAQRTGEKKAEEIALTTLRKMARGGMYDQVGGGFHRYSVDRTWLVPHFEKMLYDNAQLCLSYLEAYQLTEDPEFRRVAKEVLDYVIREMTDTEGGFYSATDADSEGVEGKFFVWTKKEILEHLGDEKGKIFSDYYGVTDEGNFEEANILHVSEPRKEIEGIIEEGKKILYDVRSRRIPPHTDDKILAAWNGLMIAAFARGSLVLKDPAYAQRATKAAEFVLANMQPAGRLARSYRGGKVTAEAFLDDYAFLAFGFLELFEVTHEERWLREAMRLQDHLLEHFWDAENGGFFMTSQVHEKLISREKPYYDGAEPSGNSISAWNLFRLGSFTSNERYSNFAEKTLSAFGAALSRQPGIAPQLAVALDYYHGRPKEIVLVRPAADADLEPFLDVVRRTYLPNRVVTVTTEGAEKERLGAIAPLIRSKAAIDGRVTAYVCENQTCDLPTNDPALFRDQLAKVAPRNDP